MKKLFKILPVVAATVPLATVPFVTTSCNKETYEDFTYVFDATHKAKDFMPKDSLGHTSLHAQDVTRTFIKNINEKKNVLADTICYSIINDFFLTDFEQDVDFTKATGEIKVSVGELDSETSRCTFNYSFDLTVDQEKYEACVNFRNVPFSIYEWYEEREQKWCFAPVYSMIVMVCENFMPYYPRAAAYDIYLKYLNDWSVSMHFSSSVLKDVYPTGVNLKVGNDTENVLKYFILSDMCLYGQTFTKVNYLNDITII